MSVYPPARPKPTEGLPLFDKPRARSEDPNTSHAAGNAHLRERNSAHRRLVLDIVIATPGRTAREYDAESPMGEVAGTFHRRLSELEEQGLVTKGAPRKCAIGGKAAHVWFPAVRS